MCVFLITYSAAAFVAGTTAAILDFLNRESEAGGSAVEGGTHVHRHC